ncbi:UNVERIFIED_CONTAM: hypothetical protein Scaly_1874300 [Sesamum calycinum]|uniref:Uncharacterized protein n=1 Tax=Sesamum calycinum TaxID=2727403 RepID=A0AAW2NGR6_9LAMI
MTGPLGEMPTGGDTVPLQEPQVQNNLPLDGAEWVDLLVKEMMNATSIDDARGRAAGVLESLEKSISSQASVEAAQNFHKENLMLKEQIETLLRDNIILKRAVAIQHERQKENDERTQEVQQLKQLVVQYQEQLRTLEVNNYALTLHLHQAQQSNSIPGRFHPDVISKVEMQVIYARVFLVGAVLIFSCFSRFIEVLDKFRHRNLKGSLGTLGSWLDGSPLGLPMCGLHNPVHSMDSSKRS